MMYIAQFRSMIQSAVNVGRPRIAGPGMSTTYHHGLMSPDGCHTTSMSVVLYWVIPLCMF